MVAKVPAKRKLPKTKEQVLREARDEWNDWRDTFLSAISKGYLDELLPDLLEALNKRNAVLHPEKAGVGMPHKNSAGRMIYPALMPGDTFLPIDGINPKYLNGVRFVVIDRLQKNYRCKPVNPEEIADKRFGRGTTRMSPYLIDWSSVERTV